LGIAAVPLATNQGFKNVICSEKLYNRYLFHYLFHILRGSIDELAAAGHGNTFLEIPAKVVRDFKIPLPPLELQKSAAAFLDTLYLKLAGQITDLPLLPGPLSEQRRIVARMEELAARIDEAREIRKQAIKEAESLVSRTITALLNQAQWPSLPLVQLLRESPRNGLSPQPEIEVGGRRMLRINAVSSSSTRFVDLTAFKQVEVSEEQARPFELNNEDVFVVRYNGDINRLAKPAIYKGVNEDRVVFPDKLIRLRPIVDRMLPDFLVFALSSGSVREQIEAIGKTTAGNIGISGNNIKGFLVPAPPLSAQHQIVAYLDDLQQKTDSLKSMQAATSVELEALMPSILDRAFRGEL
jgi:type I restriction enzyme S subunit